MAAFGSSTTTFRAVFIPAETTSPLVEKEFSKAGGLGEDELRKAAECYFASSYSTVDREAETRAMGDALVKQGIDPSKVSTMMNDAASLSNLSAKVEIVAVTVATPENSFSAVSMYADGRSAFKPECKLNVRATSLLAAAGHAMEVKGDVYIGRAFDDEREEWERRDFLLSDATVDAAWCVQAQSANAGKSLNSYRTSGAMQMLNGGGSGGGSNGDSSSSAVAAMGYLSFNESEDEIEVRFALPTDCTAGSLEVVIGASTLKIKSKSGAKLPDVLDELQTGAELSGPVYRDDSTWGIAHEGDKKVLTVTLTKLDGSSIWKCLLKSQR